MTDLEKFKKLFDEVGLEYNEKEHGNPQGVEKIYLHLESDRRKGKIDGYLGFFVEIIFNLNGTFKTFGIWE